MIRKVLQTSVETVAGVGGHIRGFVLTTCTLVSVEMLFAPKLCRLSLRHWRQAELGLELELPWRSEKHWTRLIESKMKGVGGFTKEIQQIGWCSPLQSRLLSWVYTHIGLFRIALSLADPFLFRMLYSLHVLLHLIRIL